MPVKENILLVEDDPIVGADLANRLQSLGFGVLGPFRSGEEALVGAQKGKVQLGLIDIELHGRMDGIELAKKLRDRHPIPIIFLSKLTDDHTLQEMLKVNYTSFIGKPFKDIELKANIIKALDTSVNHAVSPQKEAEVLKGKVFLRNGTGQVAVMISDILYLEAQGDTTLVHLQSSENAESVQQSRKTKEVHGKISEVLEKLSFEKNIIRCHRTFAVNLNQIVRVSSSVDGTIGNKEKNKKYLMLSEGSSVKVSATYRHDVLRRLRFL